MLSLTTFTIGQMDRRTYQRVSVRATSGALKDSSQDGEIALVNARCDELQRQLDIVLDLTLGANQVEGLAPDKSELSRRLLRRS